MTTLEFSSMPTLIKSFEKLGTFDQLVAIMRGLIALGDSRRVDDLREYCAGRSVEFAASFNGIMALCEYLRIAKISNGLITKGAAFAEICAQLDDEQLRSNIVMSLLGKLHEDRALAEVIPLGSIRYDSADNSVSVSNSYIPLNSSGLKNLLLSLGFFRIKPSGLSHLLIGPQYQQKFESDVLDWIRLETGVGRKSLSQERLEELLRLRAIRGEEAEEFALQYERKRLSDHPFVDRVRLVGRIDVTCGYDIASYESADSKVIDRFIEVKSYVGKVGFYWSRNELETARRKGPQYHLYLIDSERLAKVGYVPAAIPNPYESVYMNSDWVKEVQNWYLNPSD